MTQGTLAQALSDRQRIPGNACASVAIGMV